MDLAQAQAILELTHSALVSMDEDGKIAHWNARAEDMFGLTREQAIGRDLADTIVPVRLRDAHRAGLRSFLATGAGKLLDRRIELSALRADGSEFPIELTVSALSEGDGWAFHAFIADISDRRAAEDERRRAARGAPAGAARQRAAAVGDARRARRGRHDPRPRRSADLRQPRGARAPGARVG